MLRAPRRGPERSGDAIMQTRLSTQSHADLVRSVIAGHGAGLPIDEVIRRSWSRCLTTYALDPHQSKRPNTVEHADLLARRQRIGAVLPIARIEMEGLSKLMLHSEYSIMLTDRDGVILTYVGHPSFAATARRCGFREGVVWSEQELGTNGMGTCLTTQRPTVIHRTEHFLAQNIQLTCSAAPIFDMRGQLLAALDISGASANAQTHTLALVDMAAQNVENRALLGACKDYYVLRFHRCAEFVSTPGEGVVAFDEQGTIMGANRSALELLRFRDHQALCGQRVDRVFETSLAPFMQLAARHRFRPEPLPSPAGRRPWFAMVQAPIEPQRRVMPAAGTAPGGPQTPESDPLQCLHSRDPVMRQSVEVLRRVVDRDISVLLLGETGTGKGYCARAIHAASRRAEKPFLSVNCGAIPEPLIESELFGHKPGAFTGATRDGSVGRILQANGGTLFLDEIGNMPLPLQARLLNVIEDREVLPLGGTKPIPVDVRIISATQHDPVELIAKGQFRDDLYYRLNGITVRMPPVRQRADIPDLIRKLVRAEAGAESAIDIEVALIERLARYSWPGNVRQLRNVVRTMLALRSANELTLADFNESWLAGATRTEEPTAESGRPVAEDVENVLSSAECDALRRTLEAFHWNISAAASRLHLSRRTLYRKMHRHGLVRRVPPNGPADAGC
jgi:sigma-54 dependent transcriptional regulator, acetoin dehydrogenase operon transcriptional activator AcoR